MVYDTLLFGPSALELRLKLYLAGHVTLGCDVGLAAGPLEVFFSLLSRGHSYPDRSRSTHTPYTSDRPEVRPHRLCQNVGQEVEWSVSDSRYLGSRDRRRRRPGRGLSVSHE